MPCFVILKHDHPARHWDLLLEAGPVLRAWRLLAEPAAGTTVPAEANADHRLLYLDYEGPVSGGRGTVVRWDAGEYQELACNQFRLCGQRLDVIAEWQAGTCRFYAAGERRDVSPPVLPVS